MSTFLTSYFSCRLIDRRKMLLVQISNSVPKGFVPDSGFPEAIPDWRSIVAPYKDGNISEEEYTIRYVKLLEGRRPSIDRAVRRLETMSALQKKTPVLLCYEKPGDFCHRHILAKWLRKNYGVKVEELREPELF